MKKAELDKTIIEYLKNEVASAKTVLEKYLSEKDCCRMASDYFIRKTVGHANPADLDMVENPRYVWKCAACGCCVKDTS